MVILHAKIFIIVEQVIQQTNIRKGLTKLVVPIFIETLLIMTLGAVDTIMLSRYSDNSVAAVGVVNQIVMFSFLVFEVINIGTSVLCSQYLGAKLQKNMVQVVGVSLLLNLVVGGIVSAILHFGAETLLGWMGLRPELLKYGIGYMQIVGAFAFFQAISLTLKSATPFPKCYLQKRNGLLIRKTAIKSSRPFHCAYHPLTP